MYMSGGPGSVGLSVITQPAYHVNAVSGDDNNDGYTAGTALLTLAELAKRINNRLISPSLAAFDIYQTGAFPGQVLAADLTITGPTIINFRGVATVVDSGTVTAYTASNPAGGVRAAVTDAAQDFTAHVLKRIRLTSGANIGATAIIGSLGAGVTVANVTEFLSSPTGGTPAFVVPAPGDTYDIIDYGTSCDSHAIRLHGFSLIDNTRRAYVRDISFNPGVSCIASSSADGQTMLHFYSCEHVYTAATYLIRDSSFQMYGCHGRGSAAFFLGMGNSSLYEIGCLYSGLSYVIDRCLMAGQRNIHDGGGARNVSRYVDGFATLIDVHHRGFFGNINGAFTAHVKVQDGSQWVAESANALAWGALGNTVTNALNVENGCSMQYVTKPTMTGNIPGNDVVLASLAAIAWAAVPAIAAAPDTAYVNVRK
jgi:hypothetical protein